MTAARAIRPLTAAALLVASGAGAWAQDATWLASPPNNLWNNPANWNPPPPDPDNRDGATAFFGASNTTTILFPAGSDPEIGTLQFNAGAPAYTFLIPDGLRRIHRSPN